ncbi:MAG: hypothetical protein SchgKO_06580 [Schleiferiaceae bacterium]
MTEAFYIGAPGEFADALSEKGIMVFTDLDRIVDNTFDSHREAVVYIDDISTEQNALSVFIRLKNYIEPKVTPVVLLFDEKPPMPVAELMRMGLLDILRKPLEPETLHHRIPLFSKIKRSINEKGGRKTADTGFKIPLVKRLFDIFFSSLAIICLFPVFLITAIAIRLESKGPVFYFSYRVGSGYKIFKFYKFRSMYPDADQRLKEFMHLNQYAGTEEEKEEAVLESKPLTGSTKELEDSEILLTETGEKVEDSSYVQFKKETSDSTFLKLKDDPRITKVGKIIRNTSIDELPQLFNVLKGDFSIVGNRPLPLYEAEMLTSDEWAPRFNGPAGITGLWQVEKRGKKGEMSDEERKELDNRYAREFSFWGDIKLILRTIPALFQSENV